MKGTEITIIGAGVIGLAIAVELSNFNKNIVVIEKYPTFGQETSSRNSEVIHAGIYYPKDSLKAKLCLEGKRLLYNLCEKQEIPYKKLGKLIVATTNEEIKNLEALLKCGSNNGVDDLKMLTKEEIKKIEPNVKAVACISSPSTGIIDTHKFMKHLETYGKDNGVVFAYNCEVTGIEKTNGSYNVHIHDADGENINLSTQVIVNSAGLDADKISTMVGIDDASYDLKYCKGQYFRLNDRKSRLINKLVYPIPDSHNNVLGIHATPDLTGSIRLGPDAQFIDHKLDYFIDESKKTDFVQSVAHFLPFVGIDDLSGDTAGIRPKLSGPDKDIRDFVIQNEIERGFPNFINLIGLESPGFTACLAIAEYVRSLM